MTRFALASICIAALTTACGGMSEEDAQKVFTAAQTVSQTGGSTGGGLSVDQAAQVQFSWTCPAGGSADFNGSWEQGAGFDYTVGFDGCSNLGITLDGSWAYTFTSSGDSTSGFTYSWTYKGELEAKGDVEGSCDFDLQGDASFGGGAGYAVSVSGDACGNDVDWSVSYSGG